MGSWGRRRDAGAVAEEEVDGTGDGEVGGDDAKVFFCAGGMVSCGLLGKVQVGMVGLTSPSLRRL